MIDKKKELELLEAKYQEIKRLNSEAESIISGIKNDADINRETQLLEEKEKLEKIQKAEQLLCENGFPVNRVRMHDTIARIEIPSEQFFTFYQKSDLILLLKQIGFDYITLDMEGFRSGSMDEPYQKQRGNQC